MVSAYILEQINNEVVPVLTMICNKSMSDGVSPDRLITVEVIPLFKSANPHEVGNFRHISVLYECSKLLERSSKI